MPAVFFITADDRLGTTEQAGPPAGAVTFESEPELTQLTQNWPISRLVRLWNSLPGVQPVRRFENRRIAVARLWRALQPGAPEPRSAARKSTRRTGPALPRASSKAAAVLKLIARPQGATLDEIITETGWQPHSVRGFISGNLVKRRKLKVRSLKRDGVRVYRAALRSEQTSTRE